MVFRRPITVSCCMKISSCVTYLKKRLYHAGISKIEIERAASKAKLNIFAARPGIIIGKKGSEVEALKKELAKLTDKEIFLNIQEVRKPEVDAQLVAENVACNLSGV
jgi:small subunit ribosomal protein S3